MKRWFARRAAMVVTGCAVLLGGCYDSVYPYGTAYSPYYRGAYYGSYYGPGYYSPRYYGPSGYYGPGYYGGYGSGYYGGYGSGYYGTPRSYGGGPWPSAPQVAPPAAHIVVPGGPAVSPPIARPVP
jgi:hypothetical protein